MALPASLPPRPIALRLLLALSFLYGGMGNTAAQRSTYNILKGNNIVGSIQVMRLAEADRATYLITSYAEIDMVLKQVVRTSMATVYLGGNVVACNTMLRLNKGLRDSSNMSSKDGAWRCYVQPDAPFQRTVTSQWTTARMYFEEPVGQAFIFVESVLQDCPLLKTGPNTYTLTLPNKNVNRYVYRDGVLQEVHVDRALVDLVFRRA
jgi:hypothetical protein